MREFVGKLNSDFDAGGKYKTDAPTSQFYDLETDVNQTSNLYIYYPEMVQQMETLLETCRSTQSNN